MKKILVTSIILLIATVTFIYSQPILNEIVSDNIDSWVINEASPDWIEIYNGESVDINLGGYHLSDDESNLLKWVFPDVTIQANSYFLVIADSKDTVDNYVHSNFKISSNGEKIVLSTPLGEPISLVTVPKLDSDISYSFSGNSWIHTTPTPLSQNEENELLILSEPTFNLSTGVYSQPLVLEVTHDDSDVTLEYYLNDLGSNINTTELSLSIESTIALCVTASKPGFRNSDMVCNTYAVGVDHDHPILSLIADDSALFDEEVGLFELGLNADPNWPFWGANFWSDSDTEVHFQYFNSSSNDLFNGHADLEMHGGRESRTNPQKTFRLLAKKKYDQEYFNHNFFPLKPDVSMFKRLVVRNASGDFNAGHCRDGFLQNFLAESGLDLDANAYQPIAVYINGRYYGLMGLREKMDKYYPMSNYNLSDIDLIEEELILIEGDTLAFKNHYKYIRENDLSNSNNFTEGASYFDTKNLTDYFLSQICNNNTAWPQNNIKYWRAQNDESKWRYLLFDMDNALGRYAWSAPEVNTLLSKMTELKGGNIFINTMYSFLENQQFKDYLINRHQDLYNTVWHPDNFTNSFDSFISSIEKEMESHLIKWPTTDIETWRDVELEKIRSFINERPSYSMQYFEEYFNLNGTYNLTITSNLPEAGRITLNSLNDIPMEFNGIYFKEVPIRIISESNPNFYFSHWEVNEGGNSQIYKFNSLNLPFDKDTEIKAIFSDEPQISFVESSFISNETLYIKINSLSHESISINIFDAIGNRLFHIEYNDIVKGTNALSIPMHHLDNDLLILQIIQSENKYINKLINIK